MALETVAVSWFRCTLRLTRQAISKDTQLYCRFAKDNLHEYLVIFQCLVLKNRILSLNIYFDWFSQYIVRQERQKGNRGRIHKVSRRACWNSHLRSSVREYRDRFVIPVLRNSCRSTRFTPTIPARYTVSNYIPRISSNWLTCLDIAFELRRKFGIPLPNVAEIPAQLREL